MTLDSRFPTYPWKRYWVARDSGYSPDGGFLADPESEYAWAYPNRAVSLAELRERSVLVLLGEAGMGKSRTLIQEYEELRGLPPENTRLLHRNLNTFGVGEQHRLAEELFQGPEYGAYREGARLVVFLDSLDEAINDIPGLHNWLAEQLHQHVTCPERFQLRIASRTAGWQGSLEDAVSQIWAVENGKADVAVYEICPLRRIDIAQAASIRGIDGDGLLSEIRNKEIEALASRPVTLEFLFSQWDKEKALSSSKAELYEKGILALCEENNPERRARSCLIDPKQRMTVAGRVASALVLCGHSALWIGRVQEMPSVDIALSDITGKEAHGDSEFRIDERALRETLRTSGFFTGFGLDRMGFAHQSFAEFLAAWYLQRMGTELDQMLRPLRHQEGGKLVPKLEETAAWLASINRSVLEQLVTEQPSSLLHVDGAALTDADKTGLVQVLIDRVAAKALFAHDLPGRALRKLSHPGLAAQLRPLIVDSGHDRHSRDFAMDLVRWCEVRALAGDLASVALDPEEDHLVRVAAAHAVTWIKDDTALAAMKPLALGKAGPDPGRRLKRLVAQALWPLHLTAEEFFADPVDTDENASIGGLEVAISSGEFFQTLTPAHIPAALAWASRNARHSGYSAKRLGAGLMRAAWAFLEEPGVLDEFVTTVLAFLEQHAHLFDDFGKRTDDPLADTRKRRLLLTRLLNRIALEKVNSLVFSGDPVARQDDLPWLLDLLDTDLSKSEYKCAVKLISDLLRYDSPLTTVNRVLDRCGIDAAKADLVLRKALAWLTHPMRLKSRHVRQARESWHQRRELDEKWQPVLLDPPPYVRVRMALERCEYGDWSVWPRLAEELTLEPDSRTFNWPQDVVKQPGWVEATLEIQTRIQSVTINYLIDAEPDSAKLFESNSFTFSEMAGLTAFELLSKTDPSRLVKLTPEHWVKWAPLVVCGRHENSDWLQALRVEAYRYAPQAVLDAALFSLDKADRQEHGLTSLHEYDFLWGQPFIDGLLSRLDNPEFKTRSRRTILESLLRRRHPVGRQRACEFLAQRSDPDMRRYAAALLLTWDGVESWPLLASLLEREPKFAESFISEAVCDMRWQTEEKPAYELNEEQLAELYLWIETHFPAAQDSVHHGAYRPVARDHIKEYRESLINTLKSAGTWRAVLALERIAAALPDRDWLKWVCHRAQEQAMNTQWQAPTWSELLVLLADPHARIIRTNEDLLRVVIESLARLQDCLSGTTPMAPFLWDETSSKPKSEGRLSDFVKFHLSNDLNRRGVLINREVEIRNWPGKGRGESLDLLVQGSNQMNAPVSVVIEVKGCWNDGLFTAMETQLWDQYLVDSAHSHGIYLVGWYGPQGGGKGCKIDLNQLHRQLDEQAASLSIGNIDIRAVVVDLSLHKTG